MAEITKAPEIQVENHNSSGQTDQKIDKTSDRFESNLVIDLGSLKVETKRERQLRTDAELPPLKESQTAKPGRPNIPQELLEDKQASVDKFNETMIEKLAKNLTDSGDPKAIELARKLKEDWARRDELEKEFEKKNGTGVFFPGKARLCCCKSDGEKAQNFRAWLGTSEHTSKANCHGTNLGRYFPPN